MIVLTGGFHWSSLSTYLPTIYLPIIYLIYLSTYLSLVSFLWKKKKPDEYRWQSPQKSNWHSPTLHEMLSNPAVLTRDRHGVLSSASLKVWRSLNSAEGKTTALEFISIYCTVSIPTPHHVQSPLALTLDSVQIPHCVAGACPGSMACHTGSRAGTSSLVCQAFRWALLLKISSFIVMSCPEHRS